MNSKNDSAFSFCPAPVDSESTQEKWNRRYCAYDPEERKTPTPFVTTCLPQLPNKGRALDIAAGAGRHSLALARHGLRVDAVDISWQGLRLAQQRALEARVSPKQIQFVVANVEQPWLPRRQYEVILVSFFLYRPLFPLIKQRLGPGDWLVYETLTVEQATQPGYHRPSRPDFLLKAGELYRAFSDFEILFYDEGNHTGRATAQLLARKPPNFKFEESA